MADCAPVMIWVADPSRECVYVNRPWREFTGRELGEAIGHGWAEGIHAEDRARTLETYRRGFEACRPFELEYRLRRRDGEYRWVLDRGVPRFSRDGVFLGYVGCCIDIDDRKRAEDDLARSLERERKLRIATDAAQQRLVAGERLTDFSLNRVINRSVK
jgi:two-component system sensor kinase FixL